MPSQFPRPWPQDPDPDFDRDLEGATMSEKPAKRPLVKQPSKRTTRKVGAASIGALAGGVIGDALSSWAKDFADLCLYGGDKLCLAFLGTDTAQGLMAAIGAALGGLIVGYIVRDRANQ